MEDFYHHSAAAASSSCPNNQMNYGAANNSNSPLTWQQQAPASTSNSNSNSSHHQFYEPPNYSSWSNNSNQFAQDVAAEEDRATAVSKSHSQAEKRRRDRINAQLATLRKLVPMSEKMDKAALLESAIEHVKELKVKAMEVSKTLTIPNEVDEVTIDCELSSQASAAAAEAEAEAGSSGSKSKGGNIMIKASVSCDDQPEVYKEITRVIKGLGLTMVRADISSVGGRIKSILVLCNNNKGANCDLQDCVSLSKSMKQALHLALSRMSSSSSMGSSYRIRSKRQRLFLPPHN